MYKVFVYGTLRRGASNHRLLDSAQYLGQWTTEPRFSLYDLGAYPAMIPGNGEVVGEIFEVDEVTLAALDELEEIPTLYRREALETSFGTAWVYLYQDAASLTKEIASGDWFRRD